MFKNPTRFTIILLIAVLLTAVWIFKVFNKAPDFKNKREQLISNRLVITKHGDCRMGCRQIDREEVLDVLNNGKINMAKTRLNDHPCPTYAIEKVVKGNQLVRAVFAACNNETKVVTVIDLNKNYNCHCD